jgi:hypothetical protein
MQRAARGLILGTAVGALVAGFAAGAARADWVWPFKGNDTGGIIAWDYAQHTDARQLAIDHCAQYGKVVKPLAAQRYYGGYISFACVWRPTVVAYPGGLRVKG